ncbi:hypothetical protein FRC14_005585 [Serendipita sp. 396]|nr:hypothetical protein FRC14_005585 [Serendipita sp. 396]KAG8804457.1 hypothetical protein FRC16_007866 [Serendipita sp. 398]KAG8878418.1 hypothetical protein FRC20_008341 [Serendipita sp. 405]KAG9057942.1 hypothetical protein FS842_002634 [Serendipita sp. 407]
MVDGFGGFTYTRASPPLSLFHTLPMIPLEVNESSMGPNKQPTGSRPSFFFFFSFVWTTEIVAHCNWYLVFGVCPVVVIVVVVVAGQMGFTIQWKKKKAM